MDLALKQRLVGASVLIALAVIFLPLLFDSSTQDSNQNITIEIPQEPQELTQKILSIDGNNIKVKDEVIKKEVIADRPTIKKHETIVEIVDNSEPKKSVIIKKGKPKKEIKKIVKTPKEKPQTKKPKKTTEVIVERNPEKKSVSYRIKLGVFSEIKNAQKIKAKLIHNGIHAIVEKDAVTGMYKVYSKQYINIARTKELNKKIQRLKLKLGKTSIETLNESASDDAQMLLDTGWIVQIGLFSNQQNSIKLRDKIRKKGFVSFVDSITTSTNKKMYRVRVGPFATRDEALSEQNKVKKNMNLKGIVKPHEKQKVVI